MPADGARAVEPVSQPAQTGLHERGTAPARKKRAGPADGKGSRLGNGAEKEPKQATQTPRHRAKRLKPRRYSEEGKAGRSERTRWWS